MQSKATTPADYIAEAPAERQAALKKLRSAIKKNLPKGFKETMAYGMVGYVVPHSLYPAGYHCDPKQALPFMNFASQKNSINIYHMGLYGRPELLEWFKKEHQKRSPKKLDMGKGCVRYKRPEDIPFDLIGELSAKITPAQWIESYEKTLRAKR